MTCGPKCAGMLRSLKMRSAPPVPTAYRTLICDWCGERYWLAKDRRATRYCGKVCAASARWANSEFRSRVVEKAQKKTDCQRSVSSIHMKALNRDPAIRERSASTKRGKVFSGTRGGNGHLSREQLLLQEALGWEVEYAVPTGISPWPCARVDLANLVLKIALECDGASHHSGKQRNRDTRKTRMLEATGWVVLRFWNSEVTRDLPKVLATIRSVEESMCSTSIS